MFGLCFKVLPHLPAKVLCLVFQWLVFDLCARDHPGRFCPFGIETPSSYEEKQQSYLWCPTGYPLPVRGKEEKWLEAEVFFLSQTSLLPHPAAFLKVFTHREILDWLTCHHRGMEVLSYCEMEVRLSHLTANTSLFLVCMVARLLLNRRWCFIRHFGWVRGEWKRQRANDTPNPFTGKELGCWEDYYFWPWLACCLEAACAP